MSPRPCGEETEYAKAFQFDIISRPGQRYRAFVPYYGYLSSYIPVLSHLQVDGLQLLRAQLQQCQFAAEGKAPTPSLELLAHRRQYLLESATNGVCAILCPEHIHHSHGPNTVQEPVQRERRDVHDKYPGQFVGAEQDQAVCEKVASVRHNLLPVFCAHGLSQTSSTPTLLPDDSLHIGLRTSGRLHAGRGPGLQQIQTGQILSVLSVLLHCVDCQLFRFAIAHYTGSSSGSRPLQKYQQ